MIKRSTFAATAFILCAGAAAALAAPGCSSKSDDAVTPGGGGGGIQPPARVTTAATGTTQWFAVKALKLGITNKTTGKVDPAAWMDFGYDLDNRITTADDSKNSTNSCKRKSGSQTKVLQDGNLGRDNNFGQHVMAVIKSLKADAEDAVTQAVTDGKFTLLLRIDNFTAGDNGSAPGKLYVANDFNAGKSAPTFSDTETGWQIVDGSLVDGKTIGNPKLKFDTAYISNGYWVSGDFGAGRIELSISLSGADITLPIDSGIITMKTDGTDGTIAGAMNTTALQDALTPVAKKFGICPGNATYDQVVQTLTQSADLVSGKPNLQDTTVECNAISIALGFNAAKAGDHSMAPVKVSMPGTGTDDCSMEGGTTDSGGTDTGSSSDAASGG
ncbi:MAG: hypothetical protein ACXWUG_09590 [Polyangiales bacterium]